MAMAGAMPISPAISIFTPPDDRAGRQMALAQKAEQRVKDAAAFAEQQRKLEKQKRKLKLKAKKEQAKFMIHAGMNLKCLLVWVLI